MCLVFYRLNINNNLDVYVLEWVIIIFRRKLKSLTYHGFKCINLLYWFYLLLNFIFYAKWNANIL